MVERHCGGFGDEEVVAKVESLSELGLGGFARYVAKRFEGGEFSVKVAFWRHGIGVALGAFYSRIAAPRRPDALALWSDTGEGRT